MAKHYLEQVVGRQISTPATSILALISPVAGIIEKVTVYLHAPAGGALVFDANLNGATLFTAQANRPAIAQGSSSAANGGTLAATIAAGDRLTVDADAVGAPFVLATVIFQIEDGKTSYSPNAAATNAAAADDDFGGSLLNSKWQQFGAADMTVTVGDSLLQLKQTSQPGYKLSGVYQPLPAGDWHLVARGGLAATNLNNYAEGGLCLLETDGSTGRLQTFAHYQTLGALKIQEELWTNRTTFGTAPSTINLDEILYSFIYFRLTKAGSNYQFFYSLNGIRWKSVAAAHTITFTPTKIGIFVYNQGTGADVCALFDWIRVYATLPPFLGGEDK